jgi:Beta-lactamase enzyme family
MLKKIFFLLVIFLSDVAHAQKNVLMQLLNANKDKFGHILANPAAYEVQIIYTQIDRDANNVPHFKSFSYRADSTFYFYPASTVKYACSLLALERINQLKKAIPTLSKSTPYAMDSTRAMQIPFRKNPLAADGLPSLEQDIKEVLIVSDNYAYNRLFDFLGRDYINEKLAKKGYTNTRILHRFSIPGIDNRFTAPMTFQESGGKILYRQGEQVSVNQYVNRQKGLMKGLGYIDGRDSLVKKPFDFSGKNYFSLHDQQAMLKAVLFPDALPAQNRFDLTPEDYDFLRRYMSIFPQESRFPTYDTTYYDGYCKFFMYGDGKEKRPDHIRIFNKVGDAYGYMIDNAYIVDFEKKIEFIVSAVILSNKDGIFNDGVYEYDENGMPFFGNLGRVLYDYECKRKRKNIPDLSAFRLKY